MLDQVRQYGDSAVKAFEEKFDKVRLDALATRVAKVSRKMFEVPEFFYYAIAYGLRWLFVRHGKWRGWNCPREERGDLQMEFELLTG